jgi:hypothetical protein
MRTLEFWPDYSGAMLWTDRGELVRLEQLPLPPELLERSHRWTSQYDDSKLPWEATRDDEWLSEGKRLFVALRLELLNHDIDVRPGEAFWLAHDESEEAPPGHVQA